MINAELIFDNELTPRNGKKIPFGIHTKCKVTSITYKPGEFVDINFEDAEGRYNNKRLYQPNGKYPRKTKVDGIEREETTAEALQRDSKQKASHIVKLLHIFLGKEALKKFNGEYDEFMEKAVKALTPNVLASKYVNLKLIYDSDGVYSEFGNYADYVEEYVEGQEPNLTYSPWEKENRSTASKETPKSSTDSALTDLFKQR